MMENTRIVIISPDQTPVMVTVVAQFTDGSMEFLHWWLWSLGILF